MFDKWILKFDKWVLSLKNINLKLSYICFILCVLTIWQPITALLFFIAGCMFRRNHLTSDISKEEAPAKEEKESEQSN
jgi:hypothetical protein